METIYRTFHPVRKTVLLTPVVILVLMLSANFQQAQAQTTNSVQTATLKTTGQSMFNTGPASPINKRYSPFGSNKPSFFVNPSTSGKACLNQDGENLINGGINAVNTTIDLINTFLPEDKKIAKIVKADDYCFGGGIDLKMGMEFDLYADLVFNSGSVSVTYPIKTTFTYPENQSFGCGEDVIIETSMVIEDGYALDLVEPQFSITAGTTIKPGFSVAAEACLLYCTDLGGGFSYPSNFKTATSGNYKSLLGGGDINLIRFSTNNGLELPWDLNPSKLGSFLSDAGLLNLPDFTLPFNSASYPAFEAATNITGTLTNPFANLDGNDLLTGFKLSDNSSSDFFHMDFDPIQFQEYITGIPLVYEKDFGAGISAEFTVFSAPVNLDIAQNHTFEVTPTFVVDLDLGRTLQWQELNGNTVVQSGTSQVITGFKIGNKLKILNYPDNLQSPITPTYKINASFLSKIEEAFSISLDIVMLEGTINFPSLSFEDICKDLVEALKIPSVEITVLGLCCEDVPVIGEFCLVPCEKTFNLRTIFENVCKGLSGISVGGEISFSALDKSIPIADFTLEVLKKNFTLAGFNEVKGLQITLQPDNTKPMVQTQDISIDLSTGYPASASISPQNIVSSASDEHGGTVRYLGLDINTFGCNNLGANTVTLTADDSRCNEVKTSALVTVNDVTPPQALCKNITVDLFPNGTATISEASVDAGSNDNCSVYRSIDRTAFTCADVGPNTVTLTVHDDAGNQTTCASTVTVRDVTPPQAHCNDVVIVLDDFGEASVTPEMIDDASSDACGIKSLVLSQLDFTCDDIGPNTVTLTVTDNNGLTSKCSGTVTVEDNTGPIISLNEEMSLWPPDHEYETITVSDMVASVSDNCDDGLDLSAVEIVSISSDEEEDAIGTGDGETTGDILIDPSCRSAQVRRERNGNGNGRIYTATLSLTDANGNRSEVDFVIRVDDNLGPKGVAVDDGPAYSISCSAPAAMIADSDNDLAWENTNLPEAGKMKADKVPAADPAEKAELSARRQTMVLEVYPNPFESVTNIRFRVPEAGDAFLGLYNLQGQLVQVLFDGQLDAGEQQMDWDGRNRSGGLLPSGMYLLQLKIGMDVYNRRIILQR